MKRYIGTAAALPDPASVTVHDDGDGKREPSVRRLIHRARHSPKEFTWGYGGYGPSDLALSILWDLLDEEPSSILYQRFKYEVISHLSEHENFDLEESYIWDWLASEGVYPPSTNKEKNK